VCRDPGERDGAASADIRSRLTEPVLLASMAIPSPGLGTSGMTGEECSRAVERALASFPEAGAGERVVFGFDGYVDRVREVVADRDGPDSYERLDCLSGFGQ